MDWEKILGWGSPFGLGIFLFSLAGLGVFLYYAVLALKLLRGY